MSGKKLGPIGGLGKGIDSLFGAVQSIDASELVDIKNIPIKNLTAGKHQPRKNFTEESLAELSTSIKNQGIIQPLLVRLSESEDHITHNEKHYEIIAGERRFRAALMANLDEVPVIIRKYTDAEAMTIALVENLQREDLNVIEEAEAYHNLRSVHNLSQEELAEKLGKSRSAVANALRLLGLPSYIKEGIVNGIIKASHGRTLVTISNENDQKVLFHAIIDKRMNSRELEKALEVWKLTGVFPSYVYEKNQASSEENSQENQNDPNVDNTDAPSPKTNTPVKIKQEGFLNPEMASIESKLKDKFYKKANLKGDERKGSIKLSYKNQEELLYILDMLGIEHNL